MIEAAAGRTEKERKIPADVLSAMHACGLFHMLLPVSLGGGAVDLVTFNQVVEAVAAADASPAWCLAQAVASSHAAGFLDPKIAREVFGAPDALVAWGPPAGVAKAVIVDGGYRVTGKWRFASGSANATWMGGHSTVFETADKPRRDASGNPINRTMLFPRERANIKDTWHVIGLRGTASNDYEVADLFVREEYTTWRDSAPDRRESGPLYNIPLLTLYGVGFSGVALGIAGSCLAAFMQLAQTKTSGGGLGSTSVLRDNAVIQSRVARACGRRVHFSCRCCGRFGQRRRRPAPFHLSSARACALPSPARWRRPARWWILPTAPPARPRFSKAVLSSAGSAICTPCWRRGRRICRISNPRGKRCSGSSPRRDCSPTTPLRA